LLPENINSIDTKKFGVKFTKQHVSFTNAKRIQINNIMMHNVVTEKKKKPLILEKLTWEKNSQKVKLLPTMPIIARINNKDLDICNNEMFIIKKITDDDIIIYEEDENFPGDPKKAISEFTIPINKFQKMFYVAYCITVHKSQGSTFRHEYTIHEFEKFDNRLKYVALSRSSNIKHINIG